MQDDGATAAALETWLNGKDENASRADAAAGKAATAAAAKTGASVLGALASFVPGAGALACAIGGIAGLAKSHYKCQAACFEFIGMVAGYADPFNKWAALKEPVPGFVVFEDAVALVNEYLGSNNGSALKKAKQIKDAEDWLDKFRAMPLKLVMAVQQVRTSAALRAREMPRLSA